MGKNTKPIVEYFCNSIQMAPTIDFNSYHHFQDYDGIL